MFAILLSEKMDPFYQNISSFPTVLFTFVLGVVVLYWLVAMLGFVDIEILDFDIPDADGALDINADSGLSNPDMLAGLMLRLGLSGVPVTIIVSFVAVFGWLISYYLVYFFLAYFDSGLMRFLLGVPIFLVSLYASVMVTAQVIKPIRPLFQKAQQQTEKRIIGQTAVVRSSRVDAEFGEAVMDDGGAGLILKVRASGNETFAKGDRVVLLEHLREQGVYRVISEDEFIGS